MSIDMSGYEAYTTYLAVSRHFTSNYDFFKYNGKIKAKQSSYESRKDKYFFEKAARKFKKDDFIKYLTANFSTGGETWIGNIMSPSNEISYKKWKKNVEALTYSFKQEIDMLEQTEEDFDRLFIFEGGKHPLLFRLHLRRKVSFETMVLLDDLVNYTKVWAKHDDMMIKEFVNRLYNYRPFLHNFSNPSNKKLRSIVLEIYK
jgi:hypothetical protein